MKSMRQIIAIADPESGDWTKKLEQTHSIILDAAADDEIIN